MQDRLLDHIRRLQSMRAGERVGVAVSGGADSVALLRLLLEVRASLGVVLSVVHFNHKLRSNESDEDEQFVRELAAAHGLECFVGSGDTRAYAAEHKCGIEAAARELRYGFFWKLISSQGSAGENHAPQSTQRDSKETLDRIATAHTMDDQAETVLLRFLRGAGTRGLAGIHPILGPRLKTLSAENVEGQSTQRKTGNIVVTGETPVLRSAIVRPVLEFRRAQLRHYLKRKGQAWREDASNADPAYARNKLRHELMPKVREFNPAIEQVLSETAEIARAEEEYWAKEVASLWSLVAGKEADDRLSTVAGKELLKLPLALQRRIVRAFAERDGLRLEFHHVQQILDVIGEEATRAEKRVELPNDHDAVIRERELRLERRCPNQTDDEYDLPLEIPGEVTVSAAGLVIAARVLERGEGELLDPGRIGSLRVRNWRPGDRYWPAHTREPKKVKELLQARHVPAQSRAHWPVVVAKIKGNEQIVWVPGFASAAEWILTNDSGPGLKLEHRIQA